MSKLYYSEQGYVVPSLCEELSKFRRARKILELPASESPATLFFLARNYTGNELPLNISLNGTNLPPLPAVAQDTYQWFEVAIQPTLLQPGRNVFEMWTDAPAMNAWSLALEDGHAQPNSFVSTDGGETWRNEKLGYLNTCLGEYVVRLRLGEGLDPPPPSFVWEDLTNPRLDDLRGRLPNEVLEPNSMMARIRYLMTWVCTQWEYRNLWSANIYAPWDAETILAWGQAEKGHNGLPPVVMCVHYAVTFVSCCMALGIPARCAIFTEDINGYHGHFTAEVWFEEYDKWVVVDPTVDALFFADDLPLSVSEVQAAGDSLAELVQWGPGYDYQMKNEVLSPWIQEVMLPGLCFRHRALWSRTDFLSHPELTPPGHGAISYCETNLVWEARELDRGLAMFPHFGEAEYFDTPPQGFPE